LTIEQGVHTGRTLGASGKLLLSCCTALALALAAAPARAVVTGTTTAVSYTGNAATTAFPFSFKATDKNWVKATLAGVAQSSGFTVTLNTNQGHGAGRNGDICDRARERRRGGPAPGEGGVVPLRTSTATARTTTGSLRALGAPVTHTSTTTDSDIQRRFCSFGCPPLLQRGGRHRAHCRGENLAPRHRRANFGSK
jgi:hypothetical protein